MITILQGNDPYFIQKRIKEIERGDKDIIRLDGKVKSFKITDITDACLSTSLFSERTLVEVKDPPFLIRKIDDDCKVLLDYCKSPAYECDLVFYTLDDSFKGNLKIFKDIASNAEVITLNGYDDKTFPSYARALINESKLNIRNDAVSRLISIVHNDASLLERNIEILSLYPERIDVSTVDALCSGKDDTDSFDLINAITDKNLPAALSAERELLKTGDSLLRLISQLAGQLRFLYYVDYLYKDGNRKEDIMRITNSKEYRIRVALQTLQKLSSEEILKLLAKLSELDILSKSDYSLSDQERFELFLIHEIKKS